MAIPLFPLVLGVGGLVGLLSLATAASGAEEKIPSLPPKEKRKKSADKAKKAVQEADWQKAAAEALASRSGTAVKNVAAAMRKHGLDLQADSLLAAWKEIREQILIEQKEAEEEKQKKKSKKRKKPRRKKKKSSDKDEDEDEELIITTEEDEEDDILPPPPPPPPPAPPAPPKKKKKPVSPEKKQARVMAKMLGASTRYNEDRELVEDYQEANGLTADGMYGPGTARTLWDRYRIIPPNPYYWSSNPANNPRLMSEYDSFLASIIQERPASKGRIEQLRATIGR